MSRVKHSKMKPSKKKIIPNITKSNENEKNMAQGIQTFFKSAPKSFVVAKTTESSKNGDGPKKFYADILKEKLQRIRGEEFSTDATEHENRADVVVQEEHNHVLPIGERVNSDNAKSGDECTGCVEKAIEVDEWQQKYNQEAEQRKQLKKVYTNLTISFSELYSKYNNLLKVAKNGNCECADADKAANAIPRDDIFTPNEEKFLQCMALDDKSDCTFILHCLKYAYKSDISVLASKTLYGTAEWTQITTKGQQVHHEAKAPLTPRKVERIKGLFVERISKCKIDSADYSKRMKATYVNKLFAAGINNISKKKI